MFLLSAAEDDITARLTQPIVNTTKAASGRTWAWTLGQRYVSLAKLSAGYETTGELDSA